MKQRISLEQNSIPLRINMTLGLSLLALLTIIPLLMVILRGFRVEGSWTGDLAADIVRNPEIFKVFVNSLLLGLLVIGGTTLLALPLAFLCAKTSIGRAKWLEIVLLIPFMTPPYIGSMGWILFMQKRGFLDQLLPGLSFLHKPFFSLGGIVLVMSLHLFPFIYLILKNALLDISASLEHASAVCGGNFRYRLRRVILPLIASPWSMGALLIFVKTISEFGTPATLGRRVGFYVLTTEIYKYTSNWPIDLGRAAVISSSLLAISILIWYFQNVMGEKHSQSTIGGKNRNRKIHELGLTARITAWFYIALLLALAIGIPYFSIISTSLMELRGYGLSWNNLTMAHYGEIFTSGSAASEAIWNSVRLSLISATLATALGTYLGILALRSKGPAAKVVDVSSLLSNTVPSIVIVVGLIMFWNAPWNKLKFYNEPVILVVAYAALFLPYTVQYVKGKYQQIDKSLFSVARVCGSGSVYTTRRIVLPLVRQGILSGWIMTFIISSRELVASLMIRPPGFETTATFIYEQFEQGNTSLGMAMAVCTVVITSVILTVLHRFNNKT